MKIKQLFALLILVSMSFAACTKDDGGEEVDPPVDKHTLLYDKWWYNVPNQGRGDHFFNSNGTIEWSLMPSEGTWEWKENDSIKIMFPNAPEIVFWFKKLEENSMEYWPTNEPEANVYTYSTTKP